jgi:hypothetical protein
MEEVWRDIPGYVGIYEVSTLGRVRKKEGGRILKARKSRGYMRLWLYKDKLKKDWYVHRLVALAFLYRPPGKELINHIDGDKTNNYFKNLEWCDHKENLMHAYMTGANKSPIKVTLVDPRTKKHLPFYSMGAASRFLGHHSGYISRKVGNGNFEADGYIIKLEA